MDREDVPSRITKRSHEVRPFLPPGKSMKEQDRRVWSGPFRHVHRPANAVAARPDFDRGLRGIMLLGRGRAGCGGGLPASGGEQHGGGGDDSDPRHGSHSSLLIEDQQRHPSLAYPLLSNLPMKESMNTPYSVVDRPLGASSARVTGFLRMIQQFNESQW